HEGWKRGIHDEGGHRVVEHLFARSAKQGGLPDQTLPGADLPALELQVDVPPLGWGEDLQDLFGHVLWADGAVEVDHGGPDGDRRDVHAHSVAEDRPLWQSKSGWLRRGCRLRRG